MSYTCFHIGLTSSCTAVMCFGFYYLGGAYLSHTVKWYRGYNEIVEARLPKYYCLGHGNVNKPTYHVLNHALDHFQQAYSVGRLPLQLFALHLSWVKCCPSFKG